MPTNNANPPTWPRTFIVFKENETAFAAVASNLILAPLADDEAFDITGEITERGYWFGEINGQRMMLADFHAVEGFVFDTRAMENDA